MPEDRQPPHNVDAEVSVLGAMVISKEAVVAAQEILRPEDFYRPAHRIVYEAIQKLQSEGKPVDLVTLVDELNKEGQLKEVGGISFVTMLAQSVPTAANVTYHAKIVREKSELRHLIDAATEIASAAYEEADDVDNIMDDAEKKILAVAGDRSGSGFESIKDIAMETMKHLDQVANAQGALTGLATGFTDLDKMTAGMQPSDFIIVAARPSMGKTAFTLNIASYIGLHGGTVAFFSLEMSKSQLMQRLMAAEGLIDSQRLRTGELSVEEWTNLVSVADKLSHTNIYIDDTPGITVRELRSKARRLKAEHGLDIIIIDYLQLMQGRASKNNDSRQQEVSEISRSLKALARELDVPVIALSQLSRSVESRQVKRPMLSDLRESGSLEQDADIVMFLYREDYYDKDTENQGVTELIIAKHRNGAIGTVNLMFQKQYTRFQNLLMQ